MGAPRVDIGVVLGLLKYGRHRPAPPEVRESARSAAEAAEGLAEPGAWVSTAAVAAAEIGGRVVLETPGGGVEFQSASLSGRLAGAREAVLTLLTIGPRLERRVAEIFASGDPLEGLLLDSAGWAAVEAMVRMVRQRLAVEARERGLRLTARMAPGFGGWPLEQQRELIGALRLAVAVGAGSGSGPESDCGRSGALDGFVTLTEAGMMVPAKSVTALYGLVEPRR